MKIKSREQKLMWNTFSSTFYQIVSVVCGFVLPRLILESYGSGVNGLVNSITQFLSVIAFLELGVGAVVQSALYKPLADKDNLQISRIIKSANDFFSKLAVILAVYVFALIVFYPIYINREFDCVFSGILIFSISISSFARYYFGVVDRLLLSADQRGYIQYNAQTLTLIANTIACVILIKLGASIQVVKLSTSLIYLLRPIFLRIYTNSHYSIDRKIKNEIEPIKQKWNGVAQHFSAVVLDCADTVILTLFSKMSDVSIYSVYYLVVSGIKQLFLSMMNGVQSLIGELWAKQELKELNEFFGWVEWSIHTLVVFIFGCTGTLIVPFVTVYTNEITDANYIVPVFGLLLTIAHGFHCLRLPYNIMILAANHYKQTQNNYIFAAIVNIVVSVLVVSRFGLVGVAVGTLVAMLFQTVWMAWYISKNLNKWPIKRFIKQIGIDVLEFVVAFFVCGFLVLDNVSFFSWIILALKTSFVWIIVLGCFNLLVYPDKVKKLALKLKNRLKK